MKENAMDDITTDAQKEAPIRIDHDNVDVADIMGQIKRRIAQRPQAPAGAPAATGEGSSGAVPAATGGGKGLAKRILRRLARPFLPFVRHQLHRFIVRVNPEVYMRIQENTKLLHVMVHNLVIELTKLRIEHEALKSKMRIMEKDFEMLGKRERALEKRVVE
jgi:hypothetical protein